MNQSWPPDPSFLQGIYHLIIRILVGRKSGAVSESGTIFDISMSSDLTFPVKNMAKAANYVEKK